MSNTGVNDLEKRMSALTPEQRELLELRLRQKGQQPSRAPARAPAVAEDEKPAQASDGEDPDAWKGRVASRRVSFSVYFFSADGSTASDDKYRLVLDCARFADEHGFSAVWTPERHFQDFGGLYPNPSVLSAALAVLTERVQIRAGSVALPLHNPVRVAEEWAVVDNLSKGRAAVSFASGWHPEDFIVFAPEAYGDRKEVMFRGIELVQRLWAGEVVKMEGDGGREVEVRLLPRPVQPRLPMWVTTMGSPETWERAGAIGANVLCALMVYTPADLAAHISLYRKARAAAGHDPEAGVVSVMVHTFVGADNAEVRRRVSAPFSHYLRTYLKQFEKTLIEPGSMTETDKDELAAAAFEHYFETKALMGAQAKCARLVEQLAAVGADDVACLVDFGVEPDAVIESLHYLSELREHFDRPRPQAAGSS